MNIVKIEGKSRAALGKSATRKIRSEGEVPAVIYGGKENVYFSAPKLAFRSLVYTDAFQQAHITVDGKEYRCILKDRQFDVVTDELTHLDFQQMVEDRKLLVTLPVRYTGQAEGVKAGGRLEIKVKSLKVRAYPKDLRENLEVPIDNLKLNGNIRVQDVEAPNMEVMNSPRIPIASVVMTRALRQAESEEAKAARS